MTSVETRNITKRYGDLLANDAVTVRFNSGRVHAIVGENGAGKTTLMNCVYGLATPDDGDVLVDGVRLESAGPSGALNAGIGMIHQHFKLIPSLTVAENVVLGGAPTRVGLVDRSKMIEQVVALADESGLQLDPNARVRDLPVGIKQRVEILKMLYRRAKVLILDEPTAVLTPQEATSLIQSLRGMAASGSTIIFISHKLKEVLAVADDITVMRQGKVVDQRTSKEADEQTLARLMVGRDVRFERARTTREVGPPLLVVRGLTVLNDRLQTAVADVDLEIREGQILGLAGVEGNGQVQLVESLAGLRRIVGGTVEFKGREVSNLSPRQLRAMGIAHIPYDRMESGVAAGQSLADNVVATRYRNPMMSTRGWLRRRNVQQYVRRLIGQFDIRASGPDQRVADLSGGNIQKTVVARELADGPRLLLASNPTRGVDVGSIEAIHGFLEELREDGAAILLVSSELDEIRALADWAVVLYEGRISGEGDPSAMSDEEIGLLMAGIPLTAGV